MKLFAALLAFVMAASGALAAGPAVPSMAADKWFFRYGVNTPTSPTAASWKFNFPKTGEVDYLMTNVTINAKELASFTIRVTALSGTPVFTQTGSGCPAAAQVRVMLQVQGDNMINQDGRWWSLRSYVLKPGTAVVNTPITDLSLWSNVQGKRATERPTQFRAAMTKLGSVGLTFGGCFFGHGVKMTGGTAQIVVPRFVVR